MSEPGEFGAETDELVLLREDYARLRRAFAEALAEERRLQACLTATDSASGLATATEQHLAVELVQVRMVLDRVLHSPTWKLGSAMTTLPRRLKDRWNR